MYLIGIVGRATYNDDYQEIIQTTDAIRRMLMRIKDVVCVTLLPTETKTFVDIVPGEDVVDSKLDFVLNKCDAFVVPGGTEFYSFDEYVIEYAIKHDKPLLAICLGFQALCCMYAKDRNKHEMVRCLDDESHCGKPDSYQHEVFIKDDTLLKNIIKKNKIDVNSTHHYVVDFPLDKLKINATIDNIVEGVEYPDKKFIMGIQWHPEYLMDEYSLKILEYFISSIDRS